MEVRNPVSIDQTNNTIKALIDPLENTVKAQQSGNWTVNVTGTPYVAVTNTANVSVVNSPTVKMDATANTVKLDATTNTVKAPTQRQSVSLWSSDQTIPAGSQIYPYSNVVCAGYKELRAVFQLKAPYPTGLDASKVKVYLGFRGPNNIPVQIGSVNFSGPTQLVNQPGFLPQSHLAVFTIPVMGDEVQLIFQNDNAVEATITKDSYIYLVN